jgi:DHA1 family bicyclomycin/chloramphenicol resistance-like MFS transporter
MVAGKGEAASRSARPSFAFGIALGFLSVLGPLSIDLYLPAMPEMARALGTTNGAVQRTLSAFFLALAAAQIPIGSFGDRYGRRLPLAIGLGLFVLASIGCATAQGIDTLIAWRFLQGCGACAGTAVARAMIRDRHKGHEAARLMALSFLIIGISPVVAPYFGSLLLTFLPWRGLFLLLAGLGLLALACAWTLLPESLPRERRVPRGTPILPAYVALFGNRAFLAWALVAGIATTIPFAFVTAAPFVFTRIYGLDPHQYSLLLALNAGCSIAATQFAPGLMRRLGGPKLVLRISAIAFALTATMGLLALRMPIPLPLFQSFTVALFVMAGLMLTPAAITALDAASGGAGAAAGLLGTIQLVVTAAASAAVSLFPAFSIRPLAGVLGTALLIALLLAFHQQPRARLDKAAAR